MIRRSVRVGWLIGIVMVVAGLTLNGSCREIVERQARVCVMEVPERILIFDRPRQAEPEILAVLDGGYFIRRERPVRVS
jgi:hypothetical protein